MSVFWVALAYAGSLIGGLGLLCLVAGQLDDMLGDGGAAPRLSFVGAALLAVGVVLYLVSGGVPGLSPSEAVDLSRL